MPLQRRVAALDVQPGSVRCSGYCREASVMPGSARREGALRRLTRHHAHASYLARTFPADVLAIFVPHEANNDGRVSGLRAPGPPTSEAARTRQRAPASKAVGRRSQQATDVPHQLDIRARAENSALVIGPHLLPKNVANRK